METWRTPQSHTRCILISTGAAEHTARGKKHNQAENYRAVMLEIKPVEQPWVHLCLSAIALIPYKQAATIKHSSALTHHISSSYQAETLNESEKPSIFYSF